MTTFTTSDAIFSLLTRDDTVDRTALQNLVNAFNQNAYSNAVLTAAVLRGDVVFELVTAADLNANNAGAMYSNDRGKDAFVARGDKFAIQLDQNWLKANGPEPAFLADPRNAKAVIGIVTHEVDHNANQSVYDEAIRLRDTPPESYRSDLVGVARSAVSVDLAMKAEVSGWYADLNAMRAEVAAGRMSQGEFNARMGPDTSVSKTVLGQLQQMEGEGARLGLTGTELTNYVMDHGKQLLPSNYIPDYIQKFGLPNSDPGAVRNATGIRAGRS